MAKREQHRADGHYGERGQADPPDHAGLGVHPAGVAVVPHVGAEAGQGQVQDDHEGRGGAPGEHGDVGEHQHVPHGVVPFGVRKVVQRHVAGEQHHGDVGRAVGVERDDVRDRGAPRGPPQHEPKHMQDGEAGHHRGHAHADGQECVGHRSSLPSRPPRSPGPVTKD
jgi:hypothetical protein